MIKVIQSQRKSALLAPSSLACLADIPAINIASGCAHGCVYCYARGYSTYPGDSKVVVYVNALEKIKQELMRKRAKPQSVYFSPSTDVFQPVPEILDLGFSVMEFLLSKNIEISFLTKGCVPEKTMELLLNHSEKVKAQIGIITADDNIRKVFEPYTADIQVRLGQISKLTAAGIEVEARMMPIIPGITDDAASVDKLFQAIKNTGINKVAISTLFLRPSIAAAFEQKIPEKSMTRYIIRQYTGQERIPVHATDSSVIPLPRNKRGEIYQNIKNIAAKYDIEISVCGCMNPDIGGSCNIARVKKIQYLQPSLF